MEEDWKESFVLTCSVCNSNNTTIIYFPENHFEYASLVFVCGDCGKEIVNGIWDLI